MPAINLSNREAHLEPVYAGKMKAPKNKEAFTTLKLTVSQIPLDQDELCAILAEPLAFRALYDTGSNPVRPLLRTISELKMSGKWESAHVVLFYEQGEARFELTDATITNAEISLTEGGTSLLSFVVEGQPPLDRKVGEILERLGGGIQIECQTVDPDAQGELPLNEHGVGEQAEQGEDKPRGRGRGKKTRAGTH